ncbi:hypothetical protein WJX73_004335 [Symbiochloris irregularis]|uniref:Sec-independent protein translocase protein TatC n=1 Tax=Symbiochloris irregularis TaxID=706552 RepID=A0AAW1NPK8_9CHLO
MLSNSVHDQACLLRSSRCPHQQTTACIKHFHGCSKPLARRKAPVHRYETLCTRAQRESDGERSGRPGTSEQLLEQDRVPAAASSADTEPSLLEKWLNPSREEMPVQLSMPVWDHLDELRERVILGACAALLAILTCFVFSKDLVVFLEAPVAAQGVRFLQLSPGEFFFTTMKVAGYAGLLLATPTVLYEIIAYIVPALTLSERKLLAPIVFGSSILFYCGLLFSYEILTPAALSFFVSYADGAVESLWSIDQYFEFVLVLMLSTGLAFQVPVIQVLLGQSGIVTSKQMFSQWKFVVVGATVAAAVLTPSTDPFTQSLLAIPLIGLYIGGATFVRFIEGDRAATSA